MSLFYQFARLKRDIDRKKQAEQQKQYEDALKLLQMRDAMERLKYNQLQQERLKQQNEMTGKEYEWALNPDERPVSDYEKQLRDLDIKQRQTALNAEKQKQDYYKEQTNYMKAKIVDMLNKEPELSNNPNIKTMNTQINKTFDYLQKYSYKPEVAQALKTVMNIVGSSQNISDVYNNIVKFIDTPEFKKAGEIIDSLENKPEKPEPEITQKENFLKINKRASALLNTLQSKYYSAVQDDDEETQKRIKSIIFETVDRIAKSNRVPIEKVLEYLPTVSSIIGTDVINDMQLLDTIENSQITNNIESEYNKLTGNIGSGYNKLTGIHYQK